jgi:hypothetical protein
VRLTDVVAHSTVYGGDTTDPDGVFRIVGIEGEEFGMRVNGGARGHETGWLNGGSNEVVPTWGLATSVGPGLFGTILLDRS